MPVTKQAPTAREQQTSISSAERSSTTCV